MCNKFFKWWNEEKGMQEEFPIYYAHLAWDYQQEKIDEIWEERKKIIILYDELHTKYYFPPKPGNSIGVTLQDKMDELEAKNKELELDIDRYKRLYYEERKNV